MQDGSLFANELLSKISGATRNVRFSYKTSLKNQEFRFFRGIYIGGSIRFPVQAGWCMLMQEEAVSPLPAKKFPHVGASLRRNL